MRLRAASASCLADCCVFHLRACSGFCDWVDLDFATDSGVELAAKLEKLPALKGVRPESVSRSGNANNDAITLTIDFSPLVRPQGGKGRCRRQLLVRP